MRLPWNRKATEPESNFQVGDIWYGGSLPTRNAWQAFTGTWKRRLGGIGRGVRRVGGWVAGIEVRSEKRAISSVPWGQGGGFGGDVTLDRALKLGPVFAAGRLIADNIAAITLRQYRELADYSRQRMPLASLFVSPSTQGNRHDWIYRVVTSLAYRGNAVGFIATRDAYGTPTTVEWLHPDWVQVIDSMPSGRGSFTDPVWYVRGIETPADMLVHIPWFVLPGKIWGLSPIGAYALTVSTGLAAQEYAATWFNNGGVPPGTFQNTAQTVDQPNADMIKKRLVESIRTREPIVYGKDWNYTPITLPAADVQFVATARLTASQIAAIYGIPPELIGGETGGSMSYSSPEQRQIELVQFTLLPWLAKLESHFSGLLPGSDGRAGQYVKFNADELIRPDLATRWGVYAIQREIGATSVPEIRSTEDMLPIPPGKEDEFAPLGPIKASKLPGAVRPTLTAPSITRSDDEVIDHELAALLDTEPRYDESPIGLGKNWVTDVGGLPLFIRAIAHALIRNGHHESEAIQMAVGVVKNWASGEGHVTAKTKAKAAAALAEWEAKKGAAHSS